MLAPARAREHRPALRLRRGRRDPVSRDGARRGREPRRRRTQPHLLLGAGSRDRAADRVRARLRPCARDRPPRPHPGQRPDRARHRARAWSPTSASRGSPARRPASRPRACCSGRPSTGRPSRREAPTARPPPTCTRSAACSSGCCRGAPRSRATTGWRSGYAARTRRAPSLVSYVRGRSARGGGARRRPARAAILQTGPVPPRSVSVSVQRRRRSDRRSSTRSRRPSGRRPSSPSRSTTAALEPPRRHPRPQAPPWPPDGAGRPSASRGGRARLRRRDDRERRSRRRGAEGHGPDRAQARTDARRCGPRRSGRRAARRSGAARTRNRCRRGT